MAPEQRPLTCILQHLVGLPKPVLTHFLVVFWGAKHSVWTCPTYHFYVRSKMAPSTTTLGIFFFLNVLTSATDSFWSFKVPWDPVKSAFVVLISQPNLPKIALMPVNSCCLIFRLLHREHLHQLLRDQEARLESEWLELWGNDQCNLGFG